MKETVQQYVQRIQAKIAGKDPLRTQSQTAKRLSGLLKRGSPAKLRNRPAPDKWSVVEILAHLADVEMVTGWRLRSILAAPGTPIQAFDQDAWAAAGRYAQRQPRQSLKQFCILREANLSLLQSLSREQRKLFGVHAERGEESIERLTQLIAGHDLNHLEQIESILRAKRPAPRHHAAKARSDGEAK
jgi:DinB superfamily